MSDEHNPTRLRVPAPLQCDAPGCPHEMMLRLGGEQYCFAHAVERGNAERAAKGLPPVVIDDEGAMHVRQ